MPFMAASEELSNHLMDWFRMWKNSKIKDLKFYVVSSYSFQTLQVKIKYKFGEGGQIFCIYIYFKWQTQFVRVWQSNIDHFLMICKIMECFILHNEFFIHFDSMWTTKLHEKKHLHTYLTKFWATWRRFYVGSVEWKKHSSLDI